MIAADTSAIVAIVLNEPERDAFAAAIGGAGKALISTVSVIEVRMVPHACRGMRAAVLADDLLDLPQFEVVSPGILNMEAAFAAFLAFGKGSGHPAPLNFGGVFFCALAKVRDLPLLFKGGDFGETDLRQAVPRPS